jgi:hypothetical protein
VLLAMRHFSKPTLGHDRVVAGGILVRATVIEA